MLYFHHIFFAPIIFPQDSFSCPLLQKPFTNNVIVHAIYREWESKRDKITKLRLGQANYETKPMAELQLIRNL